jgi:hypothetical protein
MPAHKKHPSTRKRRNKASTAATLTLAPPLEGDVDWSTLTVPQLRLELAHRELPTAGLTPELVARLTEDDETGDLPQLPDRPNRMLESGEWMPVTWHPQVVAWWNAVWSSPMAEEWHAETDEHNVLLAAVHLDDFWWASDPVMRQKADAAFKKTITPLGLTPYDRRRLEWVIASAGDATDQRNRKRGATPVADGRKAQVKRVDPRAQFAAT